jgi:hypothetical protein
MPDPIIGAESLLDLAAEALRNEIAPSLSADKRYLAAMIANALDIARREMAGEAEASTFALLDDVYDDGDGTLAHLAKDIRTGKVTDLTHPDLRKRLRAQLMGELAVRNPRHLKAMQARR